MTHYHKCCKISDLPLTLNIMRLQFSLSLFSSSFHPLCFCRLSSQLFFFLVQPCCPHLKLISFPSCVSHSPSSLTTSSSCSLSIPSCPYSFFHIILSCNPAIFSVGEYLCVCARACLCAPVYVYITEANQQKIANPPQTPVDKQHTNTPLLSCRHLPPQSETLRRQLYGP